MPEIFSRRVPPVTGIVSPLLPEDFDRMDRECRHAADEFIGRDAERFAQYAGMRAQTINRQREYVPDTIAALARVRRLVVAGRRLNRSFSDVAAFLAPVCDEADAALELRRPVLAIVSIAPAASKCAREANEAIAVAIEALEDGIDDVELNRIRKEVADAFEALRALEAAATAAHGRRTNAG